MLETNTKKSFPILILLLMLLVVSPVSNAQDKLHFVGPMQVAMLEGEADFWYKRVANDTVLEGTFLLRHADPKALLAKGDRHFYVKGAFRENMPEGQWSFRFGNFQAQNAARVKDYRYLVEANGIQHEAKGGLRNGHPQGQWTQTVSRIEDALTQEVLFKSSIRFDKGIPQMSFRIENGKSTLLGRFLRDGLAHDVWELYSGAALEATEKWYFDAGMLKYIVVQDNNKVDTLQVSTEAPATTDIIYLDQRYLDLLKLALPMSDSSMSKAGQDMSQLLEENSDYYQKIDTILKDLGNASFRPSFKVKVPHYPLSDTERSDLDSTEVLYGKSKEIATSLLTNTSLNILKLSDPEASYLYAVINRISKDWLHPLKNILLHKERDLLEYIPRAKLLPTLQQGNTTFPHLSIDYIGPKGRDTVEFTAPGTRKDKRKQGIALAHQLAHCSFHSLDSIAQQLNSRLIQQEREQALVALEEKLIAYMADFEGLIDSLNEVSSKLTQVRLLPLKANIDGRLGQYSAMEDLSEKPESARLLIACFEPMSDLALSLSKLPDFLETMYEAYTEQVWNPFTLTLMGEEVKKRIPSAYKEIILPYLLEETQAGLTCERAAELVSMIEKTHGRILRMKKEDTARIERKLKKTEDPQLILQLFGIEVNPRMIEQ